MLRDVPVIIAVLGPAHDTVVIASRLYAALRELDAQSVDLIFACVPAGNDALARAVRDRLRRAAARTVPVE